MKGGVIIFCLQCVRGVPDSQQRKHNTAGKLFLIALPFQDAHTVQSAKSAASRARGMVHLGTFLIKQFKITGEGRVSICWLACSVIFPPASRQDRFDTPNHSACFSLDPSRHASSTDARQKSSWPVPAAIESQELLHSLDGPHYILLGSKSRQIQKTVNTPNGWL
jgi:hypothetical protein